MSVLHRYYCAGHRHATQIVRTFLLCFSLAGYYLPNSFRTFFLLFHVNVIGDAVKIFVNGND